MFPCTQKLYPDTDIGAFKTSVNPSQSLINQGFTRVLLSRHEHYRLDV